MRKLEKLGVAVGNDGDLLPEPRGRLKDRLRLEQVDHGLAYVHALPGIGVAVVAYAKLVVLAGGILISNCEMTLPWYPLPLDLSDPEGNPFFDDLIAGAIPFPPRLLNRHLTGEVPLRRGQVEGVIVTLGYGVPLGQQEHARIPVTLSLWDEYDQEVAFDFEVEVSYSLKTKWERIEQGRRISGKIRQPIFPAKVPMVTDECHRSKQPRLSVDQSR